MRKTLLAAALAFTPIPAHAIGYQIINGMPTFGDRPKALDVFNLDWEFANDPGWQSEVFDCSLMGYVLASFQAWQTNHLPPPIDPPPVDPPCMDCDPPPPCVMCDAPPVVAVPETSTFLMMLLGFIGLGYMGTAIAPQRRGSRT